jgi:hypothetical protein
MQTSYRGPLDQEQFSGEGLKHQKSWSIFEARHHENSDNCSSFERNSMMEPQAKMAAHVSSFGSTGEEICHGGMPEPETIDDEAIHEFE